ncbi:glycosyltransferase family 2 protein [Oxynema aestuarii AP17]|uniref:Glycosyltransferase family 2 protein n=1 Tax=Oxynema aestuarii AP17 TaxID=2064643 RepID=A0A6H1TTA7_9CYAN|nr:glycosyltransferase family 2 protein [Oxynema aestuarii AP17]
MYITLPAYNEEKSLPTLLPKIEQVMNELAWEYKIVVCDDGSKDSTREMLANYAQSLPLDIIYHKINRGLGETERDLFEYVADRAQPDDVVVRLDCDDTHEPSFIPDLVAKLDEGFDVVIASRFQPGGGQLGVSTYRAFISRCANLFMKFFFPIKGVKEYSCGFRAYRAGLIKEAIAFYGNNFLQLRGLGFTGTLEKLVKLKILGAKCAEVPFVLRYDQKQSDSKMISSITTLGYMVMTVMYHWPWGGWRNRYKQILKELQAEK